MKRLAKTSAKQQATRTLLMYSFALVLTSLVLLSYGYTVSRAATATVDIFPNQDPASTAWSRSSGSVNYSLIDKLTANRNSGEWICSQTTTNSEDYESSTADVQQGVVSMTAEISGIPAPKFWNETKANLRIDMLVGGSSIGNGTSGWSGSAWGIDGGCGGTFNDWKTSTMGSVSAPTGGEWTQSQIDGLKFRLSRSGDGRSVRIHSMYARLTYVTYSNLIQNGYRFYQNTNSVTPGSTLGSSPTTPIDINRDNDSAEFRLRMAIQTTNERWLRQYGSYKLQYALKGAGTCSSPAGGWGDVQAGSGDIRWNDNAGVANGSTIANVSGQPSGTMIPQQYVESNPITKQQQVTVNNYGIWDFSLRQVNADYGNVYCFKVVNDTGTQPINSYTNYPELRIIGNLSLDIVDASGAPVSNPKVSFPSRYVLADCQQSTSTLGTSGERIRISDNRTAGTWSISLAATSGGTAKWQSGANNYSFNDSSGSPTGCTNGQLSLDFGSINAAPKSGCTGTGLSAGSNAAFNGSTPISIGSGNGADRFCYWDITNIKLNQQIPAAQSSGNYKLDMTLTVMAS